MKVVVPEVRFRDDGQLGRSWLGTLYWDRLRIDMVLVYQDLPAVLDGGIYPGRYVPSGTPATLLAIRLRRPAAHQLGTALIRQAKSDSSLDICIDATYMYPNLQSKRWEKVVIRVNRTTFPCPTTGQPLSSPLVRVEVRSIRGVIASLELTGADANFTAEHLCWGTRQGDNPYERTLVMNPVVLNR